MAENSNIQEHSQKLRELINAGDRAGVAAELQRFETERKTRDLEMEKKLAERGILPNDPELRKDYIQSWVSGVAVRTPGVHDISVSASVESGADLQHVVQAVMRLPGITEEDLNEGAEILNSLNRQDAWEAARGREQREIPAIENYKKLLDEMSPEELLESFGFKFPTPSKDRDAVMKLYLQFSSIALVYIQSKVAEGVPVSNAMATPLEALGWTEKKIREILDIGTKKL